MEFLNWFPTHPDWIRHFKRGQLTVIGLVSVLTCFILLEAVHYLLVPNWRLFHPDIVPDLVSSLLIGLLISKVLNLAWERRQALLNRLEMVGEMNHHIRNALEVIQLSAHQTHDPAAIARIREATDRIQWALNEILPQTYEERRKSLGE